MKKKAYVLNVIKQTKHSYLDVVLEDAISCNNASNLGEAGCSSCVGSCSLCGSDSSQFPKSIRVWNKSDRSFKMGDVVYIEMKWKSYFLQIFFALILPIILFIATFFLLEASYCSEVLSVMSSFVVLAVYTAFFAICSRCIFYRFFIPFTWYL